MGFGLPRVTVSVATPPETMLAGANCFAIVGGCAWTVRLSVFDAAPVAACALETPLAWFGWVPNTLLVTTTVTVHEPFAGTVRPVKARFPVWPAEKLLPAAPAQVPPAGPAAAIAMLARLSVKPAEVSAIPFALARVKVIVEVPPDTIPEGENALAIVGGAAVTVRLALFETAPVGVSALDTPEAWLGCTPGMSLVTAIVTVQEPAAGTVRPVIETLVWPAVRKLPAAPAQVPPAAPAAEIHMLASVSVKFAEVSAMPSGLVIVNVTVEMASAATAAGPNALPIEGATALTVSTAVLDTALAGASLLVSGEVVLSWAPGTMLDTTTVSVQDPFAGTVSPVKASAVWPSVTLLPAAPAQVPPAAPATLTDMLLSVSPKAPPVSATPSVLASVKVIVELAPAAIVPGAKALEIAGATAFTVRVAVFDAAPTGAWRLETPEAVLLCTPGTSLVTTTVTVHEPLAGMVRLDSASEVCPAVRALPAAPAQVPPASPAAKIAMFASVSVNPAEVSAAPLVLASVKVIVDVPSALIVAGANAFAMVGVAALTVRVAMLDGGPVSASAEDTPEAWLLCAPGTSLVTTTFTVHEPPAGMVSPVNASAVWPAVKLFVAAPAQVPPAVPVALMAMLASVSVKPVALSATALAFASVKVIVDVASAAIAAGANALAIVAPAVTIRFALAGAVLDAALALLTLPAASVLVYVPEADAVTLTVIAQEPPAGIVPPVELDARVARIEAAAAAIRERSCAGIRGRRVGERHGARRNREDVDERRAGDRDGVAVRERNRERRRATGGDRGRAEDLRDRRAVEHGERLVGDPVHHSRNRAHLRRAVHVAARGGARHVHRDRATRRPERRIDPACAYREDARARRGRDRRRPAAAVHHAIRRADDHPRRQRSR